MAPVDRRPRKRSVGWKAAILAGVLLTAGWVAWKITGRQSGADNGTILVTSLIEQPAPILRLSDADGKVYSVPAGGRPTVLIFHMGYF